MKKRNLLLVLVLALSMCLASCGGGKRDLKDEFEQSKEVLGQLGQEVKKEQEDKEALIEKNKKKLSGVNLAAGTANMEITAYSVVPDTFLGEDILELYLHITFTNNSTEDRSFAHGSIKGYQDGIQLTSAIHLDEDSNTNVRTGTSIPIVYALQLRNGTSDVELELSYPGESWISEKAVAKFSIK